METIEALIKLRDLFLCGECHLGEIFLHTEAVAQVSNGDEALAAEVMRALDNETPGRNFHVWIDGGRLTDDGWVYFYDRKRPEIAAAMGAAICRVSLAEEAV